MNEIYSNGYRPPPRVYIRTGNYVVSLGVPFARNTCNFWQDSSYMSNVNLESCTADKLLGKLL